jgi:hypothetical protein
MGGTIMQTDILPEPRRQSREAQRRDKQRLETAVPKKVQRQKLLASIPRKKRSAKTPTKVKLSAPIVVSQYMTTQEAAAYLNLSRQFLEAARYRGDGSGPAYIKLERAVRYRRSVLDAWMSAHDHSPDEPSLAK